MNSGLSQDFVDYFAVHVGEAEISPLKAECQSLVINSQASQDRGVQIVYVDRILNDVVAVVIRRAIADTGLESAAGDPHGKTAAVMIATVRKRNCRSKTWPTAPHSHLE